MGFWDLGGDRPWGGGKVARPWYTGRDALAALIALALLTLAMIAPAGAHAERTLYVPSPESGYISAFDISQDGALAPTLESPFGSTIHPFTAAMTPDGEYLYVGGIGLDGGLGLEGWAVGAGGDLYGRVGPPLQGDPGFPAVSPSGDRLYMPGGTGIQVLEIAADGTLAPMPGSPFPAAAGAFSAAITPDGSHIYMVTFAENGDPQLSGFTIAEDGGIGAPVPGTPPDIGSGFFQGLSALVVTPDGRHLYAGATDGLIHEFQIAADGSLSAAPGSPATVTQAVLSLAVAPDGRNLYSGGFTYTDLLDYHGVVASFDIGPDGQLTEVDSDAWPAVSVAGAAVVTPDGRHVYVSDTSLGLVPGEPRVFGYARAGDGTLAELEGSPITEGVGRGGLGVAVTPNQPPVASLAAPNTARSGESIAFDASGSTDPDGSVATYDWDFGDGETLAGAGPTVDHAFGDPGTYEVTVTLTDNEGCSTEFVFTGQMAHCNGSEVALATRSVEVKAPAPPDPGPQPGPPADLGICGGQQVTLLAKPGEKLTGTSGADVIRGTAERDVIDSGDGNDLICGGDGKDRLRAGPGDDKLKGNVEADRLAGGSGDDILVGGPSGDLLAGGAGDDLCGLANNDRRRGCER